MSLRIYLQLSLQKKSISSNSKNIEHLEKKLMQNKCKGEYLLILIAELINDSTEAIIKLLRILKLHGSTETK